MTIGAVPHTTTLVEYDSQWPFAFNAETEIIRDAFAGCTDVIIEHIGSTAVPGMAAKPTIDIMLALANKVSPSTAKAVLKTLGYQHYPDDTIDGRMFFTKDMNGLRIFNLSLVSFNGIFWGKQLVFRNTLRNDPELAEKYVALKRQLAARFKKLGTYTMGKTDFIENVLNAHNDGLV